VNLCRRSVERVMADQQIPMILRIMREQKGCLRMIGDPSRRGGVRSIGKARFRIN